MIFSVLLLLLLLLRLLLFLSSLRLLATLAHFFFSHTFSSLHNKKSEKLTWQSYKILFITDNKSEASSYRSHSFIHPLRWIRTHTYRVNAYSCILHCQFAWLLVFFHVCMTSFFCSNKIIKYLLFCTLQSLLRHMQKLHTIVQTKILLDSRQSSKAMKNKNQICIEKSNNCKQLIVG